MKRITCIAAVFVLMATAIFASAGELAYVEGNVALMRAGRELPADFGTVLEEGDVIFTDANSMAIIALPGDRGEVKLLENSEFSLDSVRGNIHVGLRSGSAFARLRNLNGSRFQLRAAGAVAGVRGTEFFTSIRDTQDGVDAVWLCVNEGSVEVQVTGSRGGSTMVDEGLGVVINSDSGVSDPAFFEWTQGLNWNFEPSEGEL